MPEIGAAIRAFVKLRAKARCEYCRIPESLSFQSHEVDRIVAVKHGGAGVIDNRALCCALCNKYKGTDVASIDRTTGLLEPLYNPRREDWLDHFLWRQAEIMPNTAIGRVTVKLLQFNRPARITERNLMLRAGVILQQD